jgi:hypothetical protein
MKVYDEHMFAASVCVCVVVCEYLCVCISPVPGRAAATGR